MKKLLFFPLVAILTFPSLVSCDPSEKKDDKEVSKDDKKKSSKELTEDERIEEALVGRYYQDDNEEEGIKMTNIKGEFFSDGKFVEQLTIERMNPDTYEEENITIELSGDFKVKDKFLFYTLDFDKIRISPKEYGYLREGLIESFKNKNTPQKIIEYDKAKIIYEDSDGERTTMKKTY